jgi:hypothetical protein
MECKNIADFAQIDIMYQSVDALFDRIMYESKSNQRTKLTVFNWSTILLCVRKRGGGG